MRCIPFIGADTNADFGIQRDPTTTLLTTGRNNHIDTYDPNIENKVGTHLISRLASLQYAVYNSFFDTGPTFISQANGSKTRIDALIGPLHYLTAG